MATEATLHVECAVCKKLIPAVTELGYVSVEDLIAVAAHISECSKAIIDRLEKAEDMISFQQTKLEEVKKLSSVAPPVGYTFCLRGGKFVTPIWKSEHLHLPSDIVGNDVIY